MIKLAVGKRYRIKHYDTSPPGWNHLEMPKWMGKIVTIRRLPMDYTTRANQCSVKIEEDIGENLSRTGWYWRPIDFEVIPPEDWDE